MSHAEILNAGVESWNRWRRDNARLIPDLRGVRLSGKRLQGLQLEGASLIGADLTGADIRESDLSGADLRGAQLTEADLRGADLRSTILADLVGWEGNSVVDITGADFSGATFGWTVIGDIYLNRIVGLGRIRHAGPSYISTSTIEFTALELDRKGVIRSDIEEFLRKAGVLMGFLGQFQQAAQEHPYYTTFISYSHKDAAFAHWLHEKLEGRKVRCWLDEKNIRPGSRILNAVGDAISTHDRVVLCCSQHSLSSWWVKDEIRKVHDLERETRIDRIIPIILDDHFLTPWDSGLASDLRSRLGINFKGWVATGDYGIQLEKLFGALRREPDSA